RLAFGALAPLAGSQAPLAADDPAKTKQSPKSEITLPSPAEVQSLTVQPTTITLVGADESRQLILAGNLAAGRLQDLSGDIKYEVADSKIVRVTSAGRVIPLANGATTITARYGDKVITIPV